MPSPEYDVVIVGAGPTGLMLAGELSLAGIHVALIERRPTQEIVGSRAGGLIARTLEIFDQRGIADRFLAAGQKIHVTGFSSIRLDISQLPTRHNYVLGLRQRHIERILADWIEELDVSIHRGREVTGFTQDDAGVRICMSDDTILEARYLVGCDGGRSLVRKAAGIDFPGWDATTSHILAEVDMAQEPPLGVHRTPLGIHAFGRDEYEIRGGRIIFATEGPIGVMVTEKTVGTAYEPTLDELREALVAACGTDYGIRGLNWISRFSDMSRQAATYRKDRVFLAGDAAHIHSPVGGKGLNVGVQDAVNLGWKLARVVKGASHESVLDTYHSERHPVAARVLHTTMAQVALQRTDQRTEALRDVVAEMLRHDVTREQTAAEMTGLDIHYESSEEHPLVGRRMPDLDLMTPEGATRVFDLLHDAQPLLLNLGTPGCLDAIAKAHRIRQMDARHDAPWILPVLGKVNAPTAVLIRPDGHVAWAGVDSLDGLEAAMEKWFVPAA